MKHTAKYYQSEHDRMKGEDSLKDKRDDGENIPRRSLAACVERIAYHRTISTVECDKAGVINASG